MSHESMIGILPAAGFARRFGVPYPKELLVVDSCWDEENAKQIPESVIETSLDQLYLAGIYEAIIVTRPGKEVIREHLGNERHGVKLTYVNQRTQRSREGLPDAVASCYDIARHYELCVMLMPDVYFSSPTVTKSLVDTLQMHPYAIAAASVWHTDEPERFGVTQIKGRMIQSVIDKPSMMGSAYHWGAVAFRPEAFGTFLLEEETLSNSLNTLVPKGVIASFAKGRYYDLGTPFAYFKAIKEIHA